MTNSPAGLMRRNLLEVFNEPDPARRAAVIAVTYTEDVVWHEPDRIIRGRKELERREVSARVFETRHEAERHLKQGRT